MLKFKRRMLADEENSIKQITMSKFQKEVLYDNDWTNSSLGLLKKWVIDASERVKKHCEKAKECKLKFNMMSLPGIITGSLAAALAFWAIGDGAGYAVRIALAFLSSMSAIFKGAEKLLDFKNEENQHINAAYNYEEIVRRMEVIIFTGNKNRNPLNTTLQELSLRFSSIVSQSPPV